MKITKYLMIAAVTMAFAACSNEENVVNDEPVAAQVYAEISNMATSRASAESWDDNDKIGISTIDGTGQDAPKTKYANIPYKYSATKFAPVSTVIYFEDTKEVTFRAYYPYAENPTDNKISVTTTDQANQTGFDYLFANGAKASKGNPYLKFEQEDEAVGTSFQHRMSQLTFTFQKAEGQDGVIDFTKLTSLKIVDVVNKGSFDITNGNTTLKESLATKDKDITTSTFTDVNRTKTSVILLPQNAPLDSNQFKIELTLDDVVYHATLTLPQDKANGKFTAGVNVGYTITIKKTALEVSVAGIFRWETATGDDSTAEM